MNNEIRTGHAGWAPDYGKRQATVPLNMLKQLPALEPSKNSEGFEAGQKYYIHNGYSKDGSPMIEGVARLVRRVNQEAPCNYWHVIFDNEPGQVYARFVIKELRVLPELERYEIFGKLVWGMIKGKGGSFLDDEWSEEIMPMAEAAGLCSRVKYDPEIHGPDIDAEPGGEIWWWGGAE